MDLVGKSGGVEEKVFLKSELHIRYDDLLKDNFIVRRCVNRTEGDAAYGKEGIMVGNDFYVKKIDERSSKGEEKEVFWRRKDEIFECYLWMMFSLDLLEKTNILRGLSNVA